MTYDDGSCDVRREHAAGLARAESVLGRRITSVRALEGGLSSTILRLTDDRGEDFVPNPLKYAVVERERRLLVRALPEGTVDTVDIIDRYLDGTRLRLREMRWPDGRVLRKLGHKRRLTVGPVEVACTSLYLDDAEWQILLALPCRILHKVRHRIRREGLAWVVDRLDDGTLLAEIDDAEQPPGPVPAWLDVIADVSDDEEWTGGALAERLGRPSNSMDAPPSAP